MLTLAYLTALQISDSATMHNILLTHREINVFCQTGCENPLHVFCFIQFSLKMECEKLAQEKTEMQRHYVMVSIRHVNHVSLRHLRGIKSYLRVHVFHFIST